MKRFYKFLATSILASLFATGSAFAFLQGGPTGLSIGVIANQATFDTFGTEYEGDETNNANHSKDVDFPSLFIEYTKSPEGGGIGFSIGAEWIPGSEVIGAKTRTDTEGESTDDSDSGDYTGKAEVENHATIYVEPGYYINDYVGLYGKLGVSYVQINSLETLNTDTTFSDYGDQSVMGGTVGLGVTLQSPWGIFLKAEATRTDYQSIQLISTSGNENIITADTEQDAVRVKLGFNF